MIIMPLISNQIINLVLGRNFRNKKEGDYSSKIETIQELADSSNISVDVFSNFSDASIDNILLFVKNFKIEPEVMYSNKQDITKIVKSNADIPTLYAFNSHNNRFLDDILLFANINESYIAKDMECDEEKIQQIFLGKELSKGIFIFINDGQESDEIGNIVKKALGLQDIIYLKRLNACDVYFIK